MTRLQDNSLRGLYAITDASLKGTAIEQQVALAIAGGARVIQYRDKSADQALRLNEASAIMTVCRQLRVPLLINDDIDLALRIGANGVHIGKDDGLLKDARAQLGQNAIIGVSCYNQLSLAEQAEQNGASYVAFGRFFNSSTKPEAKQASLSLLEEARKKIACPIVAIGGITSDNGRPLIQAGADMLAVIRGIFAADDVTAAARTIDSLFSENTA